ncbi:hypothetical protein B0A48_14789 [Cryoendolithus antarcticus]|uniref:Uncharacterized protein n=1 Tax=Cryoendolithus antarcticus TaxID=1507870 RepID=A0A1V8SKU1_9PEZI|nr:hypothetical protein B0A48_14789 [Cryoendolithus antarcticus]
MISTTATKRKREDATASQRKGLPPPTRPKKEDTTDDDGEVASDMVLDASDEDVEDSNSDLDDSDTDERQPFYTEKIEALPKHPAWDLEWRNITEDNTASFEAVTDVIGEHENDIDRLTHSLLWAAKISSDQGMKKPTYALVGPMVAGKSSVLNAMLDKNIAVVADVGEACTSVITVYMDKVAGQTSTYGAEILYPSDLECKALLTGRIGAYELWHLQWDNDWSAGDQNYFTKMATSAVKSFPGLVSRTGLSLRPKKPQNRH